MIHNDLISLVAETKSACGRLWRPLRGLLLNKWPQSDKDYINEGQTRFWGNNPRHSRKGINSNEKYKRSESDRNAAIKNVRILYPRNMIRVLFSGSRSCVVPSMNLCKTRPALTPSYRTWLYNRVAPNPLKHL